MAEKRKHGVYRANFTYQDPRTGTQQRCRQSLGTRDGREAAKREAALRIHLEQPPEEVKENKQQKQAAFSGFAKHWLDLHVRTNCKPSYVRSTEQCLRVHLVRFFADRELRDIGVEHVESYKAAKAKVVSPKTLNNHLGVLGKMFNSAIAWGYTDRNPVAAVKPMKDPPKEIQFWEAPHSEAFLAKARVLRPEWYPFFLCALRTGMRMGELFALRWQDVDFVKGILRVTWNFTHGSLGTPKSGKGRVIPMSAELQAALAAHRHLNGELVFPWGDGSHLTINRVKHPFRTCVKAAGVPLIRLHDLRHSFASQLVVQNVPLKVVQELLGHADIRMTMRYAHLSPAAAASYVQVLDAGARPNSAPSTVSGGGKWGGSP